MILNSVIETQIFAKDFISKIEEPTVLALDGSLGAGKTTFLQGLAENLGITKRVLSPTFVFLRSYKLNDQPFKYFHHFDLYRCKTLIDVKSTGIEELVADNDSLIAIEWPNVAKEILPKETIWLKFEKIDENKRKIEIV